MFRRQRCSKTLVITVAIAVTYILACNLFTLYHLSKSKPNYFVHKYGLLYLGHLQTFKNWTCKPVLLSKIPLPSTALASYPGSGNSWLRHLLQQTTGIATGSEYVDFSLKYHGFLGEGITNSSVLVVKTHEYGNTTLIKYDRAILLIRAPEEALLAEFNRRYAGHLGHAQKLHFKKEWKPFLFEEMDNWYNFNKRWLTFKGQLYVVKYDELVQNTSAEMAALLKFLNISVSSKELLCVVRNVDGHFKRPGTYHNYSGQKLYQPTIKQTLAAYWREITMLVHKKTARFVIN